MSCHPGEESGINVSKKEELVQLSEKPNAEAELTWSRAGVTSLPVLQRGMATFEQQTVCVVEALLSDLLGEDESTCSSLETDSAPEPTGFAGEFPTTFDPVVIAGRLRQMGDQCNLDFERVSSEPLTEVLRGKVEKFGAAVDSLIRRWSDQNPQLGYERAFLCVSVKLVMYLIQKVPAMRHSNQLTEVINGNSQVRKYIEDHGGWENFHN